MAEDDAAQEGDGSEIYRYIQIAMEGDGTIGPRLELLEFKCWYYETARAAGTTDIPREVRKRRRSWLRARGQERRFFTALLQRERARPWYDKARERTSKGERAYENAHLGHEPAGGMPAEPFGLRSCATEGWPFPGGNHPGVCAGGHREGQGRNGKLLRHGGSSGGL